jgi:hypothetical protein
METTNIPGQLVAAPISSTTPWEVTKTAFRVVGRVLVEGARADDFNRAFTSPPGAQFGALPRSQQNRLLDRGFRP